MNQSSASHEIAECIDVCRQCQSLCLAYATGHCLEQGGRHTEPEHLRTMLVCAWSCGLAADVMSTGATLHRQVCALCADVCDACITSCHDLDGMQACIDACTRCKERCEAMTSQ